MYDVAVARYREPLESLRTAVGLVGGLQGVRGNTNVFIKPNFCLWREGVDFPKYGVLTTARLIEDVVILLKEHGVERITLVEGIVEHEKGTGSTLGLVSKGMGLDVLAKRYGVKMIDVLRGSFARVKADGETMAVNRDILEADYVVNMPVLKTHSQTMVSLGIKNLKGILNIPTRKMCHSINPDNELNHHLARLPDIVWPSLTVIDGIYSLERGPLHTGRAYRSDIIIASEDVLSADKVASTMLGMEPATVPHLALTAARYGRPVDLSDVKVAGGIDINTELRPHKWEFEQNENGDLPLFFEKAGVQGLSYPAADTTMCTYCADFIYYVIQGLLTANNRDEPFDDIEVLHGKMYDPSGTHKHTLLVGQCQVKRNAENARIRHCVKIGGCPPSRTGLVKAYSELGIELPEDFLERMERNAETFMKRYEGKPEFDPSFYELSAESRA